MAVEVPRVAHRGPALSATTPAWLEAALTIVLPPSADAELTLIRSAQQDASDRSPAGLATVRDADEAERGYEAEAVPMTSHQRAVANHLGVMDRHEKAAHGSETGAAAEPARLRDEVASLGGQLAQLRAERDGAASRLESEPHGPFRRRWPSTGGR